MKEKKLHLEFIRATSMLLVIFNHTYEAGYILYSIAPHSPFYYLYMFLSVSCKVAVPLYWMVSGALLLPKEESVGRIFKHRILRMLEVLLLFSAIFYVWQVLRGDLNGFDATYFFKTLYTRRFAVAYWFLYAYIGMMLILPFLRRIVKNLSVREFHYLFLLVFAVRGVLPVVEYLIGRGEITVNAYITVNIFTLNATYFMAGYYFENVLPEQELTGRKASLSILGGWERNFSLVCSCSTK